MTKLSVKRALALTLALVLTASLLAGCGKKEDPAAARRAANEIAIAVAQDLDESLDPHYMVAAGTKEVLFNVYEGLVKPDADGNLVGAVAERWELSDDRLSYTFYLREGVKFSDGTPVTEADVVFSIERCRKDALVAGLDIIDSVEAGEGTVTVNLTQPNGEFLAYLTLAIVPEASVDALATSTIGTGPYRISSRAAQTNFILERNEHYWGTQPAIAKATYLIYENAEALIMALKSGAVDVCAHLTATQTAQLGEEFEILEGTMNLVQAVYLNHKYEPLANETVRKALCHAVNREEIFAIIADGHGTALGSSIYPNFRKYFLPELADLYPYDVEKAKTLLKEAGYENGFSLTITVPTNSQPHVDTAQVVAEQLRAVGVDVTIEGIDWGGWVNDVYGGRNFEATIVGFDASTLTARALLERWTSTAGKNMINHNNAEYDAAFARALAAADEAEQDAAYLEMETILAETAANVYIQDLCDLVAVRSGIEGYAFYPLYVLDLSTLRYA